MNRFTVLAVIAASFFVICADAQNQGDAFVPPYPLGRSGGVPRGPSDNGCDGPDTNLTSVVNAWKPETRVNLGWRGNHVNNNPSPVTLAVSKYPSTPDSFTLGVENNIAYKVVNYTYALPAGLNQSDLYVLRFSWDGWVSCHDFYVHPSGSGAAELSILASLLFGALFSILF